MLDRRPGARLLSRRRFMQRTVPVAAGLADLCLTGGHWATAEETVSPARFFDPRTRESIRLGLAYLASHQHSDGSFGTGGYSRNVAICGLCGMAFLASGNMPGRGKYGPQIEQCVNWILRSAQENGFITAAEAAGRGPMYGHGFATLFLAEIYGATRDPRVREKLAAAVQLIIRTQNGEGGWRYEPKREGADVSVTVCQIMALRAARNAGLYVPNETVERSVQYVRSCQNADGGFMYQASQPDESLFPRSAAALVALYSAGIYEGPEIHSGLDYLMRHVPQANAKGEQSYYFYGHYYAVQAVWHAGGKYWETWYPAIRDVLLSQQRDDGSWRDPMINAEYGTAMAVLILHMPSNYLPIFQR